MIDFNDLPIDYQNSVGQPTNVVGKNIEELIDIYETLFTGAYTLSQPKPSNPDAKPGYQSALEWLRTTDFYKAPASTQYHESIHGGLLTHSLKVYNKVIDLLKTDTFKDVNIAEVTLVALVHDWCKIDYYIPYNKNVKDEKTGKWKQEVGYKVDQRGIPLGHGATSLYLASRVMRLTPEQALAIRWHQSHWNVCKVEENELQKANESFPMVHLIQFADQLAITKF